MHSSQVSSGGDNAYQRMGGYRAAAAQGCKPAADCNSSERSARADKPQRSDEGRPARNPLVAAMMEALKGLAAPAAPAAADEAASAGTAVPAATKAEGALSVKDAAMNFANELYSALRAAGESAGSASPKHRGYGSGGGYGDLAQGLQRLAQNVAAPATPAPAPSPGVETAAPQASAPSVAKAAPPEPPARAQKAAPPEPPARALKAAPPEPPKKLSAPSPAPAPAPITINISINIGGAANAAAADGTAADASANAGATDDSPLLKAFKDLMAALNPKASGAVDSETASQRLQAFLQQIAQSLGGDAGAQAPDAALPAKGSLINVTA